jgi:SAM-dependent methyltransferase
MPDRSTAIRDGPRGSRRGFFRELTDRMGFSVETVPTRWAKVRLDLCSWVPLGVRPLAELLHEIRGQTDALSIATQTILDLADSHAREGYAEEGALLAMLVGQDSLRPYDRVYRQHGARRGSFDTMGQLARTLVARDHIRERVVIDMGCGNGRDVIGYAEAGASQVVGVDESPAIIECLQTRLYSLDHSTRSRTRVLCTPMERVLAIDPTLREGVDVIAWNSVLHLMPRRDVVAFLRQAGDSLLRQSGIVAIANKTQHAFFNTGGILLESWEGGNSRLCVDGLCRWFETPECLVSTVRSCFPRVLFTRTRVTHRDDNRMPDQRCDVIATRA